MDLRRAVVRMNHKLNLRFQTAAQLATGRVSTVATHSLEASQDLSVLQVALSLETVEVEVMVEDHRVPSLLLVTLTGSRE